MVNPREVALKILYDIEKNKAYANISFAKYMAESGLIGRDAAFVKELVYGVLKRKLTLDATISAYSSVKIKKIAPYVLSLLRMGLYQLFYMDKVPQSAAVNETVKLGGKYAGKSRGFLNAVLRKAASQGESLPTGDSVEAISVTSSHPVPLVQWYFNTFGEAMAKTLLKENNEVPALCLRANVLKNGPGQLMEALTKEGFSCTGSELSCVGIVVESGNVQKLSSYETGNFTLQDQSAQLAALALSPQKGQVVFDVCAAPGGKTTHIAELMENCGEIVALDVYEKRLCLVLETAKRLGLTCIQTVVADASTYDFGKQADRILLDVPCSGLGVIRRRPDIKYKENITDFTELVLIQRQILEHCAAYLKPGGYLVYSTCTVNPEENEKQIEWFLKRHKDFSLAPPDSDYMTDKAKDLLLSGMGTVYPHKDGGDGFFIARLKRS